jgi:hypothetical protein
LEFAGKEDAIMADNEYLKGKLQIRGTGEIKATNAVPKPAGGVTRHEGSDLRDGKKSGK